MNTAATLISTRTSWGGNTAITGPPGSYYFALLTASPGTTDPSRFVFSGAYATNQFPAGWICGGSNVSVLGWQPGTARSFMVFGWDASAGPNFNPAWLSALPYEFGISSVGNGIAGGFDSQTSTNLPSLSIFGPGAISSGFNIAWGCLSCNPPQIMVQPQDQSATEGMSVRFMVSAMLTPSLTCQWFCNGVAVPNATNFVLELDNVALSQNGNAYSAFVRNPWGSVASATATLTVTPAQALNVRSVPGLSIAGQPGTSLDVVQSEAIGSLATWSTGQSLVLTNARQWCFDLSNFGSQRFYSTVQSSTYGPGPTLEIHMVPAITLTGGIGSQIELEYINQFGSTNVWVPIATVLLTNSSQLYFDTSAIGQPPRFYRAVPQ